MAVGFLQSPCQWFVGVQRWGLAQNNSNHMACAHDLTGSNVIFIQKRVRLLMIVQDLVLDKIPDRGHASGLVSEGGNLAKSKGFPLISQHNHHLSP